MNTIKTTELSHIWRCILWYINYINTTSFFKVDSNPTILIITLNIIDSTLKKQKQARHMPIISTIQETEAERLKVGGRSEQLSEWDPVSKKGRRYSSALRGSIPSNNQTHTHTHTRQKLKDEKKQLNGIYRRLTSDIDKMRVNGWEKRYKANSQHKKVGVIMWYQTKWISKQNVTRGRKEHFFNNKVKRKTTIIIMFPPNNRAAGKWSKKLTELKEEREDCAIIVGDFTYL